VFVDEVTKNVAVKPQFQCKDVHQNKNVVHVDPRSHSKKSYTTTVIVKGGY